MTPIPETTMNLIAAGTKIEGQITFDQISRVQGTLVGEVLAKEGSTLILGETSLVEGNIQADTLMVDGHVQGNISAKTKVFVSHSGRVVGNIQTRSLVMEFGAYFEGRCTMDGKPDNAEKNTNPS